jgi:hypothetical protein
MSMCAKCVLCKHASVTAASAGTTIKRQDSDLQVEQEEMNLCIYRLRGEAAVDGLVAHGVHGDAGHVGVRVAGDRLDPLGDGVWLGAREHALGAGRGGDGRGDVAVRQPVQQR